MVNVTVGLASAKYVGIRSGLKDGDQVIYAGYENLKEGDPVVPTEWGPSGPLALPPATGESASGTLYTCPKHPEVVQDHPGDCPKCGMKLVPKTDGAPAPSSGGGGTTHADVPGTAPDHAPRPDAGGAMPKMPGMGGM